MKKRNIWIIAISTVVVIIVLLSISGNPTDKDIKLDTEVKLGTFEILVNVTGELKAERYKEIRGPEELQSRILRFNNIKIQDLIPEGTIVKEGDYVATLDRTEADNQLKDIMIEVEKANSQFTKTQLDTTMNLRDLRDELINLKFATEEAEIKLEQSKFEPPATIRQAQIELDKTRRAFDQAKKNYELKVQRAIEDMSLSQVELNKAIRRRDEMNKILNKFIIKAPGPGMVIYQREWGGQKRKVGSEIDPWDLTVATLPDLTSMITKTYVNEIDISKVKVGQTVKIGVDAFPDKKFTGLVTDVANIGEQLPNTDAKVFEVIIKLDHSDPILRPSMTTSNGILIARLDSVLSIPLECVHGNDSMTYVYKKDGTKQVVVLGDFNENEVIIEKGLRQGEKIYLSVPEGADEMELEGEEYIAVIKQKALEKKAREEEIRKQNEKKMLEGGMIFTAGGDAQEVKK
jgi:HlyD family secretion protein